MKRIVLFALAEVAILACNKAPFVSSIQEADGEVGTYSFTLNAVAADDLTKTSYADEKTFSWSANDEISVLFHNGEDHQFFTLKTTAGGSSADFSGTITSGYELGASTTEGGVKWALFPAGAHAWDKTDHKPVYNVPAVTDFTVSGAHSSTNIPMYAKGTGENVFTFYHSCPAYKFTFNNLDVTKVRFTVTHNLTHALSGNFPVDDGSWWAQYADAGSAKQSVSYIKNVSEKTAEFYFTSLPKYNEVGFKPTITLTDESTGFILYQATAKSVWSLDGEAATSNPLQPDTDRMVILPAIPAAGTGVPLISQFGIDWATVDMYPLDNEKDAFPSSTERISEWKATSDATYIYFYYKIPSSIPTDRGVWESYINTGYDIDNNSETGGNNGYGLGGGLEAYSIIYPFTNSAKSPVTYRAGARSDNKTKVYNSGTTTFDQTSSGEVATYGSTAGSYSYVEARVPRERIGSPAASSTIRINVSFSSSATGSQTITLH